MSPSLTLRSSI